MLYQVGSVQFSVLGLNPHEYERKAVADFAPKDVIGALRPQEAVGEGDDELRLTCKVFSKVSSAALAAMDQLDQMRLAQRAVICVRGDGYSYGWRQITELNEKGRKLDLSGVGKIIEFDIALKKVPKPSGVDIVSQLFSIATSGLQSLFSDLAG